MSSNAGDSITFFSKESINCPVCGTDFHREDMRTGRGRLIAGSLTRFLRRLYEPTEKYGEVYPLIYPVTVCPNCLYAAFPQDFSNINPKTREALEGDIEARKKSLKKIFPELDFNKPRNIEMGIAAYHYCILSLQHFPKDRSPTVKSGVSALRAAWLCEDLHRKVPGEHFDYLANIYYHKAWFYYTEALNKDENGEEGIADAGQLGPDVDQNYGYDGVLYIAALLEFLHGPKSNPEQRHASLQRAKTMVGRLFGHGRASKDKPSTLLERAKEVYREINQELKGNS
ncbi:MAG TPA: DUF2225 domain-containing protein [Sediminispirochaeta sp.]|nr:DUF2225 domain-containing protein [Sediminispirochaeta sp.]